MPKPLNILLVEDEDNIAIAMELLLKRIGAHVTRVADGDQALPNIRAQSPDLVILDVTLPGQSGYAICQAMRLSADLADIPVLLVSARSSAAEQRKGLAMGANAFLAKPFSIEALMQTVRDLTAGGRNEG
nr:response regulator [uncultured Celeribacter sp.]